jgi:hypothetical protein
MSLGARSKKRPLLHRAVANVTLCFAVRRMAPAGFEPASFLYVGITLTKLIHGAAATDCRLLTRYKQGVDDLLTGAAVRLSEMVGIATHNHRLQPVALL